MNLRIVIVLGLAAIVGVGVAGIPEPDVVLYGTVTLHGSLIHASDNVTVIARVDGVAEPVGLYRMGGQPTAGDQYVLRIRLETPVLESPLSAGRARIGQTARIFVKEGAGAEVLATSLVISDRGMFRKIDLSDVRIPDMDTDGDSDLADHALFQRCFTGAGTGPLSPSCQAADLNGDGKVNLTDYDRLADRVTGPS